jgi:hypothetical protein
MEANSMSTLLRDLRVGQWVYADNVGTPGNGEVMGRIICLPRIKDQQVVVLERADEEPVVVEPDAIEFMADTQEQLHEQLWQLRVTLP